MFKIKESKLLSLLFLVFLLILGGCSSGISQSEYDKVIAERDSAIQERDSAIQDRDSAIQERDKAIKEKNDLEQEKNYLEQKYSQDVAKVLEITDKEFKMAAPKAWAVTAFGDDVSLASLDDKYLEIIVPTGKSITEKNVEKYCNQVLKSIATLTYACKKYPDNFPYDKISVTYIDNNSNGIFKTEFTKDGSDYSYGSTLISMSDTQIIMNGISNSLNDK